MHTAPHTHTHTHTHTLACKHETHRALVSRWCFSAASSGLITHRQRDMRACETEALTHTRTQSSHADYERARTHAHTHTHTHTYAQRNTRYDPISTCTGILTCSSPYAAQRDGSPHLLLSHTHTDLHMQIQNHLMSTHTLARCLHAHYKHRETVCYPASTYPGILSCTDLHMQDVESRHAHMHVIQHTRYSSVPFPMPGQPLCIFHVRLVLRSVPLHTKAHSLFLPPSLAPLLFSRPPSAASLSEHLKW